MTGRSEVLIYDPEDLIFGALRAVVDFAEKENLSEDQTLRLVVDACQEMSRFRHRQALQREKDKRLARIAKAEGAGQVVH